MTIHAVDSTLVTHRRVTKSVFLLILLSLAVTPTAVVGPVLSVHKQLHLELGSQHGFSGGLFFLLYGFDLCLENKICVSLNTAKVDANSILRAKILTMTI